MDNDGIQRSAVLLMSLGDERKVSGQIEIGQMALADVSLMALGVDGAPGAGGFWSSARFPTFAAWPMAFDLDYPMVFDHQPGNSARDRKQPDGPGRQDPFVPTVGGRCDASDQRDGAQQD